MEKFEVKLGSVAIDMFAIVNYAEIKNRLGEKLTNPICNNATDKKELELKLKEYTDIRKPIVKERANANKLGTAKVKEILEQFDEIKSLVDEYKLPLLEKISEYDEQNRLKKLVRLEAKFIPEIDKINIKIEEINDGLQYKLLETLEFDEAWTSKSEKAILIILNDFVDNAERAKFQAENNLLAVATKVESLKLQYDLQSDINYQLILGNRIYTDGLADLQYILEDFAADQQRSEVEAAERAEQEALRKLAKEQQEKHRIEEEKKYAELNKIRAEEKAKHKQELKIEKEKIEAENQIKWDLEKAKMEQEKETFLAEAIKKAKENKKEKIPIDVVKVSATTTKTHARTLHFPELTKEQADKMCKYFNDNDIKFETKKEMV